MGKLVLVAWNGDKGISDDLKHVLVIFWLEGPPTAPQDPKWSQMDDLVFHEKL